mmetsp:Transcript_31778/g.54866  ORF Transcript_31778/g.54866 Transcript_31778/m.54866 type:complete len:239 (+) Transcript_31778:8-724(+)
MNPDISKVKDEVELELKAFEDISNSLASLSNSPYYEQIYDLFNQLKKAEEFSSANFKEHLKVILLTLVDNVWKPPPKKQQQYGAPSFRLAPKTSVIKRKSPERTTSPSAIESASEKLLQPPKALTARKSSSPNGSFLSTSNVNGSKAQLVIAAQDIKNLSEFSHVQGSVKFSKSERKMHTLKNSPGPGAYKADKNVVMLTSPKSNLKTSGKKTDLFTSNTSPGPAAYKPMRHYVSKRT